MERRQKTTMSRPRGNSCGRARAFRRFDTDEAAAHDLDVVGAPDVEMTADAFRVTHAVRREYVGEVRAGSDGLIARAPVAITSLS
jgi:hypothetical protein